MNFSSFDCHIFPTGAHHIAGPEPDARQGQGDVEAAVPDNISIGRLENELDRLGLYIAEAEAMPVQSSDREGGDASGGSTEPTDPESAAALEGQIVVEGKRVKSARIFGREVRSDNLVWLVVVLMVLVVAMAITVPVIISRGKGGEPSGDTAQESSDVDELSLDISPSEEVYNLVGDGDCLDSFGNVYNRVRVGNFGEGDVETECGLFCSRFQSLPGHVGLVARSGDTNLCGKSPMLIQTFVSYFSTYDHWPSRSVFV